MKCSSRCFFFLLWQIAGKVKDILHCSRGGLKITLCSERSLTAPLPLPPHSVRFSRKAKRISLRIVPGKGLEVVLPAHADPSCVPDVLARHRRWIEMHLNRVENADPKSVLLPPERIPLKGGREVVIIRVLPRPGPSADAGNPSQPFGREEDNGAGHSSCAPVLTPESAPPPNPQPSGTPFRRPLLQPPLLREISLREGSREACLIRLRHWVREEAQVWLGGMLEELAREHGFSFTSMSVRFQKTRWGSCSLKGRINLNACLLFLPERLVRYILLHELCHTRQMNHGPAFWKQVFAVDPDALVKDKAMRGAWKFVPTWIQAEK